MRVVLVIVAPCLLVAGAIGLAAIGYFDSAAPKQPPAPTLSPEQVATKMLPNLDKDLKIDVNRDVEVMDVHIEKGSITKVAGSARNTTDHPMLNTELVFDLTNRAGSRLGAVSTKVARIEPKSDRRVLVSGGAARSRLCPGSRDSHAVIPPGLPPKPGESPRLAAVASILNLTSVCKDPLDTIGQPP